MCFPVDPSLLLAGVALSTPLFLALAALAVTRVRSTRRRVDLACGATAAKFDAALKLSPNLNTAKGRREAEARRDHRDGAR